MYDVTDPRTLENVKDWLRSIEENISEYQVIQRILVGIKKQLINSLFHLPHPKLSDISFSVTGNKMDLKSPAVTGPAARALAARYKLPLYEVSAKSGENLEEAFNHLTRMVLEAQRKNPILLTERKKASVTLDTIPIHSREEKGCCFTS